ncbi:hypothetical protein FWP33_25575 [Vibrio parahaemolyticus]|jgi:ParB/RepB/Spo0J family partition protein|nr:hypothetical protein [Vibrio parahaemolyticus]ELA8176709.1 ParB N-terminal domain-containing protein [Vibrio alginolyticus]EJC7176148.1 ParB N-terminal domain-containing protein [Vibrio parahaemolyticus]EJE4724587.1 ParB N-terminal domain-containing protein [Vibrio parahaemolyticus]EJG0009881.1 ParB N-terminal domain-containing protein [Vibrio parahaemolyticus]
MTVEKDTQGSGLNPYKHDIKQSNNALPSAKRELRTQGGNKLSQLLKGNSSESTSGPTSQAQTVVAEAKESDDIVMIPFDGGELKFVKHIIPASDIKTLTYIDNASNGRNQELVTTHNVNSLTVAIRNRNQLQPAYGFRGDSGLIEIIDGQRRSLACFEAGKDFTIYVCDGEYPLKVKRELRKELQLAREHSWYDLGVEVLYHELNSGEDGQKLTGKEIAKIMGISEAKVSRARKAVGIPISILKLFYDHNLLSIEDYNTLNSFVSLCAEEVTVSDLESGNGISKLLLETITTGDVDVKTLIQHLNPDERGYVFDHDIYATKFALEFAIGEPKVHEGLVEGQLPDDGMVTLEQLHQLQISAIISGVKQIEKTVKKESKPKKPKPIKTDFLKGAEDLKNNRRWKADATWEQEESGGNKQKNGNGTISLKNVPVDLWKEIGDAIQDIVSKRSKKTDSA